MIEQGTKVHWRVERAEAEDLQVNSVCCIGDRIPRSVVDVGRARARVTGAWSRRRRNRPRLPVNDSPRYVAPALYSWSKKMTWASVPVLGGGEVGGVDVAIPIVADGKPQRCRGQRLDAARGIGTE